MTSENKEELLRTELDTYQREKATLVKQNTGKFVLIKGEKIEGIFESQTDAIKVGIEKFGNKPFLVKKIEELEQPQNYTSNLIGVCH